MIISLSRRAAIALTAGLSSVGILGGTALGYNLYYADRIVPGVTIMGQAPAASQADELRAELQARIDKATITFSVEEQTQTASLSDLGVTLDLDKTLHDAMAPSRSLSGRMSTPFKGIDIPIPFTVDEEKLRSFAESLLGEGADKVTNAGFTFNQEDGTFTVTPAAPGKTLSIADIEQATKQTAQTLTPSTLTLDVKTEDPTVTTADIQAYVDKAQALLHTDLSLTDGIDTFTPDIKEKASWLKLPKQNTKPGNPEVEVEKVTAWVKDIAQKTDVEAKPGVNNVNSKGKVVSVYQEGTTGWKHTNGDAIAQAFAAAFQQGKDYSGVFDYDKSEPEMTTRLIADGDKANIYAAAPGEKWVDIDLANNTVSGYEGGTIVYGPIPMVPGAPETPTVTGTFKVWYKTTSQTMRGFNVDGTRYETPGVPWVTYFHGDYAIHGAPWRSSFGWSGPGGSHGCVNMPVDGAQWFYEFAPVGTTVVSHY